MKKIILLCIVFLVAVGIFSCGKDDYVFVENLYGEYDIKIDDIYEIVDTQYGDTSMYMTKKSDDLDYILYVFGIEKDGLYNGEKQVFTIYAYESVEEAHERFEYDITYSFIAKNNWLEIRINNYIISGHFNLAKILLQKLNISFTSPYKIPKYRENLTYDRVLQIDQLLSYMESADYSIFESEDKTQIVAYAFINKDNNEKLYLMMNLNQENIDYLLELQDEYTQILIYDNCLLYSYNGMWEDILSNIK